VFHHRRGNFGGIGDFLPYLLQFGGVWQTPFPQKIDDFFIQRMSRQIFNFVPFTKLRRDSSTTTPSRPLWILTCSTIIVLLNED
jgi:hypothetical protein